MKSSFYIGNRYCQVNCDVFFFCLAVTVSLESQEAAVLYLPYLITVDEIVSQIAVAGFKAFVKSKPRPLQLSPAEVERLSNASVPEGGAAYQPVEVTTLLKVTGMHCQSCVTNIQDNIGKLPGVSSVAVSLEMEQATVQHDPRTVTVAALQRAIEALPPGKFRTQAVNGDSWPTNSSGSTSTSPQPPAPLSPLEISFLQPQHPLTSPDASGFVHPLASVAEIHIEGMTCNSCVQSIEGMISQKKGVRTAKVSLADHQGTFEFDPLVTSQEEIRDAIEDMGFDAFLPG